LALEVVECLIARLDLAALPRGLEVLAQLDRGLDPHIRLHEPPLDLIEQLARERLAAQDRVQRQRLAGLAQTGLDLREDGGEETHEGGGF